MCGCRTETAQPEHTEIGRFWDAHKTLYKVVYYTCSTGFDVTQFKDRLQKFCSQSEV